MAGNYCSAEEGTQEHPTSRLKAMRRRDSNVSQGSVQMNYASLQNETRLRLGVGNAVSDLVDRWSALVEECKDGYRWDVSELNNEIRTRDALEAILSAPELQGFVEHRELAARVYELDQQYRSLLQSSISIPGRRTWWRRGVLQFAGEEYARYMEQAHGFKVQTRR